MTSLFGGGAINNFDLNTLPFLSLLIPPLLFCLLIAYLVLPSRAAHTPLSATMQRALEATTVVASSSQQRQQMVSCIFEYPLHNGRDWFGNDV